jgi:hypothetical protein
MKTILLIKVFLLYTTVCIAQANIKDYPEPEFAKEVYAFRKEKTELVRLEKQVSKMKSKAKLGGVAGAENSYSLEDYKSNIRFTTKDKITFVFTTATGSLQTPKMPDSSNMDEDQKSTTGETDMPDNMPSYFDFMDPSQMISLYQATVENNSRRITISSMEGMRFISTNKKESKKFTYSLKKVRPGYFEMVPDKPFTPGEYAFIILGSSDQDNSTLLFAFGIDQ